MLSVESVLSTSTWSSARRLSADANSKRCVCGFKCKWIAIWRLISSTRLPDFASTSILVPLICSTISLQLLLLLRLWFRIVKSSSKESLQPRNNLDQKKKRKKKTQAQTHHTFLFLSLTISSIFLLSCLFLFFQIPFFFSVRLSIFLSLSLSVSFSLALSLFLSLSLFLFPFSLSITNWLIEWITDD